MKNLQYVGMVILVILGMVLTACSPATPQPTAVPKATDTTAPEPTKVPTLAPTATPEPPKNLVLSLEDVKKATIQIEAQGTFIDPQVGMVVNGAGRGSGFIIDSSGIAVTNNHVVTGAALLKVWVGGNKDKVYNATVLGVSECSDLAVIKINGSDFPYLQWYTGTPKVGLEVYAAGYPLGDPEYTLTKGIVSKEKTSGDTSWASIGSVLEHDARINPGNSGGPLVDNKGQVVGINFASNNSSQYFAIARTEADEVLKTLESGSDVTSIGVNGEVVQSDDGSISGVWVSSVKSGSPADKSGVKAGDIIVQLEGLVLGTDGTMSDYCQILRSHKASDTLSLNVMRWSTKEVLEGQLNGRALAVTGSFDTGGGTQPTEQASGPTTVYDDSYVISMDVPQGWEYDGSVWENSWDINGKSYAFSAQTLTASPDVYAYTNGWDTTGIFIATSRDWGKIGGYANLLDGVKSFYTACQPSTTKNYDDGVYEGQMMLYTKCGTNKTFALVLAARPKADPQAYLFLVEMKYATDVELNELDAILTSSTINP